MLDTPCGRQRLFPSSEKETQCWQQLFEDLSKEAGWRPSLHTMENMLAQRVTLREIDDLMREGEVRAIETGTDDPHLKEPRVKFLVRHGKTDAAIAVGVPMIVITAFRRGFGTSS
jgi:hypothetical protein